MKNGVKKVVVTMVVVCMAVMSMLFIASVTYAKSADTNYTYSDIDFGKAAELFCAQEGTVDVALGATDEVRQQVRESNPRSPEELIIAYATVDKSYCDRLVTQYGQSILRN